MDENNIVNETNSIVSDNRIDEIAYNTGVIAHADVLILAIIVSVLVCYILWKALDNFIKLDLYSILSQSYKFLELSNSGKENKVMDEFTITANTVAPVTNAINSGLNTLVPIGIGIMGTFIGIALIKRIIYTFL